MKSIIQKLFIFPLLLGVIWACSIDEPVYDFYQIGSIRQEPHVHTQDGYKLLFYCVIYNNTDATSKGTVVFKTTFGEEYINNVTLPSQEYTPLWVEGHTFYPFSYVDILSVRYEPTE